ncbi:hypothetical protein MHLP_03270 [Candidatus Mycoplasma haematolamae str. Purdue]|uniref:Uncharacterized protein n=1 Tax=Mycoplasma haematolamae (strain Purdue) TaxID=1212765 RepID=I7CK26_MYCHA|nr:hypothetical protein [Candidatus Mycoplasma haematolamae]AFO52234.1 hypothetical protein MHLP_03270 [Candidatus Mycoplasma haematolamae str. Purdue]
MFTFAKFVISALGFLTVSSTGAVVAPAAFSETIYQKGERLKSSFELTTLKDSERELKSRLDLLKKRIGLAIKVTEVVRDKKLKSIHDKFSEIDKEEGRLKEKYEEISKKIEKLSKLLKDEANEASKKMQNKTAIAFLETYERYFEQIARYLHKWDKTILEIVCVINKTSQSKPEKPSKQQSEVEDCNEQTFAQRLAGSVTAAPPPARAKRSAKSTITSSGQEPASKEALQKLESVKQALEGMSKEVEDRWKSLLINKDSVSKFKGFLSTYESYLEFLDQIIKTAKKDVRVRIEEDTTRAKEIVQKINGLNDSVVKTHKEWEKLKERWSVFKVFEGKIVHSLCSLLTIKEECPDVQSKLEEL